MSERTLVEIDRQHLPLANVISMAEVLERDAQARMRVRDRLLVGTDLEHIAQAYEDAINNGLVTEQQVVCHKLERKQ